MRRFLVFAYVALFIAACSPQEPQTESEVEQGTAVADDVLLWHPAGASYVFACEEDSNGMRCVARAQQQEDAGVFVHTA